MRALAGLFGARQRALKRHEQTKTITMRDGEKFRFLMVACADHVECVDVPDGSWRSVNNAPEKPVTVASDAAFQRRSIASRGHFCLLEEMVEFFEAQHKTQKRLDGQL